MIKKIFFLLILFSFLNATAIEPILIYPEDNEILSDEFYFICLYDDEATITLEISDDSNFNNIIYQNSNRWLTVNGHKQFPISPNELGNGTYYWRISHENGYTQHRTFSITGQNTTTDNYKIIRDINDYPLMSIPGYSEPMILSSLWIRSENTKNGLCQKEKGGAYRGMVLKDNIIYISYCDNLNKTPHLNRFNAQTGESMDSIHIDYGDFDMPNYALSDLNIDDAGNIYTTNKGNASNQIFVDVLEISNNIATVSRRYTCIIPDNLVGQYVNYAKATGNVATGEFSLYSALESSDGTAIYKIQWEFKENISTSNGTKIYGITISHPEGTQIYPINSDYYILDNKEILPTIYKNRTKKGDLSKESTFEVPANNSGNGLHIFSHGNVPMMIYGCNYSQFELITLPTNFFNGTDSQADSFTGISSLQKFPTNKLGNETSVGSTISTLATTTTETTSNGYPRTTIYVYSSGNGLAAYQLSHYTTSTVASSTIAPLSTWNIRNGVLSFSKKQNHITINNINGVTISQHYNTDNINISKLQNGIYVIQSDDIVFKLAI